MVTLSTLTNKMNCDHHICAMVEGCLFHEVEINKRLSSLGLLILGKIQIQDAVNSLEQKRIGDVDDRNSVRHIAENANDACDEALKLVSQRRTNDTSSLTASVSNTSIQDLTSSEINLEEPIESK